MSESLSALISRSLFYFLYRCTPSTRKAGREGAAAVERTGTLHLGQTQKSARPRGAPIQKIGKIK